VRAPHFHVVETIPAQSKVRFQPPASRRSALPPAQGKGTPAFVDLALSAAVVLAPPLLHVRLRGRAGAYLVIVCVCVCVCGDLPFMFTIHDRSPRLFVPPVSLSLCPHDTPALSSFAS
jgi:hypothetical protein